MQTVLFLLYLMQLWVHSRFVKGEQISVHGILGGGQNIVGMICKEGGVQTFPFLQLHARVVVWQKNPFSESSNWLDLVDHALTPTGDFQRLTVQQVQILSSCHFWHQIPHYTSLLLKECFSSFFTKITHIFNVLQFLLHEWRLKQQTNGNSITVGGQKLMLDNSIDRD